MGRISSAYMSFPITLTTLIDYPLTHLGNPSGYSYSNVTLLKEMAI